jgi:hypothetical protein
MNPLPDHLVNLPGTEHLSHLIGGVLATFTRTARRNECHVASSEG